MQRLHKRRRFPLTYTIRITSFFVMGFKTAAAAVAVMMMVMRLLAFGFAMAAGGVI